MACRDTWSEEYERREIRSKLDKLTRMLCGLCKRIEHKQESIEISPVPVEVGPYDLEFLINDDEELKKWWKRHKREDRKRERAERIKAAKEKKRQDALDKLTHEERKLLGVG